MGAHQQGRESSSRKRLFLRCLAVVLTLAAGAGVAVALAAGAGGLDPSFGTGGTTVLTRPTETFPAPAALTPAGKLIVVTSAKGRVTVSRLLENGAPDPTFDTDGEAVIEEAGDTLAARAVAMQPDGKIVIVGQQQTATEENAIVWRLNANGGPGPVNGALDTSFDTDGTAVIDSSSKFSTATGVAIQPDGKIVVVGQGVGPNLIAVWRLEADGGTANTTNDALDPSFDTDGVAGISYGEDAPRAEAVALEPDGKIVIAGSTQLSGDPPDAAVWRVKADGGPGGLNEALDPTFDVDGQANLDNGGQETAFAVAVQPDGKIVAAGSASKSPEPGEAIVWRLTPGGGTANTTNDALDPTFDTTGYAEIRTGGSSQANTLALQPDGKMVVAGSTRTGVEPATGILWRLTANGGNGTPNSSLDPSFGSGGSTTVSGGNNIGTIVLQPDRRILGVEFTEPEDLLVFRALGDPFNVTVTKAGNGSGVVSSSPAGLDCGTLCAASFADGSTVTLSATPAAGSSFAAWSGSGCSGTATCSPALSSEAAVTATFISLKHRHFVLRSSEIHLKSVKRRSKTIIATVTGLPAGARVSALLLAGKKALAKAKATARSNGLARLTFKLSHSARKRLKARKLKTITLRVTAVAPADTPSVAALRVKLRRG